jgi:hypothetical protein
MILFFPDSKVLITGKVFCIYLYAYEAEAEVKFFLQEEMSNRNL